VSNPIWNPQKVGVAPGKEGLYHLAINAWTHGLLREGFYLANAAYYLDDEAIEALYPTDLKPTGFDPIYHPTALKEIYARAITELRQLKTGGKKLKPEPNAFVARNKRPWMRTLSVLHALRNDWPKGLEPREKIIIWLRHTDGIGARTIERYAILAGQNHQPTPEIGRGIARLTTFYHQVIIPRVYAWEYLEEVL